MKRIRPAFQTSTLLGLVFLAACGGNAPLAQTPTASRALQPSDSVALVYDSSDGSLLKADQAGLERWRGSGQWETVNTPQTFGLSGVVVNPDQPGMIYVSGPGLGVMRSDDGGQNWQALTADLPSLDVTALALHSFRRQTLYVWLRDMGMYRTEDGGAHWARMPDEGPPDKDVRGLTHSTLPGSMNTGWLYAATPTGAYLSMDCF